MCDSVCVPVCVLLGASFCVLVCLGICQNFCVSLLVCLYFHLPSIFNSSISLFSQPRLPPSRCREFPSFSSQEEMPGRKQSLFSGWMAKSASQLLHCWSQLWGSHRALHQDLCIMEIPCCLQDHPLAPQLPPSNPPASSEALPKCLNRSGGEEKISTRMGSLFPTAFLPESRYTGKLRRVHFLP